MNEDWLIDDYDYTGEGILDLPKVFTIVHDGVTRKIRGKRNVSYMQHKNLHRYFT